MPGSRQKENEILVDARAASDLVFRLERNGLGRREKWPQKIGRRRKDAKNRETGECLKKHVT